MSNVSFSPAPPDAVTESKRPSNGADLNGGPEWTAERGAARYQIHGWGAPYFHVNARGHVEVRPNPDRPERVINLFELAQELKARGLDLPLLIRFSDIVADRIKRINEAFLKAIAEYEYPGIYRGVYPVKVNQQRHLVEEIVEAGRPYSFGLEAGSKPELLIALAAMQDVGGLIICNGYKDSKYIETALVAQKFDKTVIIVLERLEEIDLVFRASEKLGIRPLLGVRAKLTTKGVGRWKDSAGERAKFGLTTSEMIEVVDRLTARNMLDTLQLLHFHIGSQISSIIPIKNAMQEASNIYVELAKMGCKMGYLDVGGGLAVDYDGSKTDFHASKNYQLEEYASDVVAHIQAACVKSEIPVPTLVSESGRAVAAHHSVLVFEVVGENQVRFPQPAEPKADANRLLRELYDTYCGIQPKNVQESYHDASQAKEEAQSLFKYGYLSLRERSQVEKMYWNCCEKIHHTLRRLKFIPEELTHLDRDLSAIYYCNFSVFQSAPDIWAIDQLFPIMPIHRLGEEPTRRAVLADITCDSDGKIDHFIDRRDVKSVLELHPVNGHDYYLGIFLIGAYQEILGDLHNLFGNTNTVHVSLASGGGYQIEHVVTGDTVTDVLRYVSYSREELVARVRRFAELAVRANRMSLEETRSMLRMYEEGLAGYTYLERS